MDAEPPPEGVLRRGHGASTTSRPGTSRRSPTTALRAGLAHGTVANCTNLLNAIFAYAVKRNLALRNPVPDADTPRARARDTDIRFLWMAEVERLIAHVPDDDLGAVERVMYLTAAMTGLRQGELLALRWEDVDLDARRLRVRFSIARGRITKPKTRASERTVPLPAPVVKVLKEHRLASRYGADEDAVFAHPTKGTHYCVSTLIGRFRKTCRRAGLDRPGVNVPLAATHVRHHAGVLGSTDRGDSALPGPLGHGDDPDLRCVVVGRTGGHGACRPCLREPSEQRRNDCWRRQRGGRMTRIPCNRNTSR